MTVIFFMGVGGGGYLDHNSHKTDTEQATHLALSNNVFFKSVGEGMLQT